MTDGEQRERELAAVLFAHAVGGSDDYAQLAELLAPLIERREADAAAAALEAARVQLAHHSNASDDPCEDRGAYWPCDVARALWPDVAKG